MRSCRGSLDFIIKKKKKQGIHRNFGVFVRIVKPKLLAFLDFKNNIGSVRNERMEEKLRYIAVKPTAASGRIDQYTHKLQSCVRFSSTLPLCFWKSQFGGDQTLPVFWLLLLGPFMTISYSIDILQIIVSLLNAFNSSAKPSYLPHFLILSS